MKKQKALNLAKNAKNDEFYTQYEMIEAEMSTYLAHNPDVFRDKVILCPCDNPEWSNFTKYFTDNQEKLGIKKVISSYYDPVTHEGNDFRSDEVTKLRDEADFIITNPPFSLFREFVAWIRDAKKPKQFSVIGNMNAITYKEVFPLLRGNEIWLGATNVNKGMYFRVSEDFTYAPNYKFEREIDGVPVSRVAGVCWFTNIVHGRRHQPLSLMTKADNIRFSKHKEIRGVGYSSYDNYDAIEVPFTDAIPSDHKGVMGVPISFLGKYSSDQFIILGMANSSYNKEMMGIPFRGDKDGRPTVDGNTLYARIFIKHRSTTK